MFETSENALGPSGMRAQATLPQTFRILVVIPTLGERLDTLQRTLTSIHAQSCVHVDILLVAKTETSGLIAIAHRYNARVILNPGNISAAINMGFAQATTAHKYAGWLGDDDMLRPNALAVASDLLERAPTAVLAYGSCDYINREGLLLFTRHPPVSAAFLLQLVPGLIKQETCLFRISALRQAGGLNEKLKYTMDLDLLLKLRRLGPFVKADQVLAAFCWHAGSLTIQNRAASLEEAQEVQGLHARGIARLLYPMCRYPIKALIQLIAGKINKDIALSVQSSIDNGN